MLLFLLHDVTVRTFRAARRQVNFNRSECTCGLSRSQSLGKDPINNPVAAAPVTHTHMDVVRLTEPADAQQHMHTVHALSYGR